MSLVWLSLKGLRGHLLGTKYRQARKIGNSGGWNALAFCGFVVPSRVKSASSSCDVIIDWFWLCTYSLNSYGLSQLSHVSRRQQRTIREVYVAVRLTRCHHDSVTRNICCFYLWTEPKLSSLSDSTSRQSFLQDCRPQILHRDRRVSLLVLLPTSSFQLTMPVSHDVWTI